MGYFHGQGTWMGVKIYGAGTAKIVKHLDIFLILLLLLFWLSLIECGKNGELSYFGDESAIVKRIY